MVLGTAVAATALAMALAAFQDTGDFYSVGLTEQAVIVVDSATGQRSGTQATGLVLTAMIEPQQVFGRRYQQAELFMEFDCVGHRSRALRMIARTIGGDYVGEDSRPDDWQPTSGAMRAAEDLFCRDEPPFAPPQESFAYWRDGFLDMMAERREAE